MTWRQRLLATGLVGSLVVAGAERARAEAPAPAPAPAGAADSAPPAAVPAWRPPPAGQIGGADPKPDDSAIPYYNGGYVLVPTLNPKEVPFRLRVNHVSQFRYTNSMDVDHTYVTHLGVEREVLRRNDIQLTRDVFYFSGFAFDPRLDFNILIYTSSATLSATAAGFAGFVFNRAFALRAGFFSLPSTRSMTGTYPFFHSTDRSMANNYMRPGFTQGVWANGELFPGFNYIAMVGNSLNTLDIAATKIDFNFAYAASIWYDLHDFGKEWNDYERPRGAGRARGHGVYLRARGPTLRSVRVEPGEQLHLHLRRHLAVRDRFARDRRHRLAGQLLPVGHRRRPQIPWPRLQRRIVSALAEQLRRRRPAADRLHVRLGLGGLAGLLRLEEAPRDLCPHVAHPGTVRQAHRGRARLQLVPVPHAARLAERRSDRNPRLARIRACSTSIPLVRRARCSRPSFSCGSERR